MNALVMSKDFRHGMAIAAKNENSRYVVMVDGTIDKCEPVGDVYETRKMDITRREGMRVYARLEHGPNSLAQLEGKTLESMCSVSNYVSPLCDPFEVCRSDEWILDCDTVTVESDGYSPTTVRPGRPKQPVAQYTTEGELVKVWPSSKDATVAFGGKSKASISLALSGKTSTAYGYVWKKVGDTELIENQ